MINLVDSPARPPIGTPSMTTRSSGLGHSEIRTTKLEESTWSGIAIEKLSIPSVSIQRSIGLR
jgi:hypothetical protein